MTFIAREPKKINIRLIRKGKSYEAEEVLRRLRSFLDRNEAEPVKILRGFWKDQQDALSYGEIREAILAGHISEQTIKEWRQDYAKLVNEQFSHTWKNALAVGYKGQPIMDNLSSFHFDMQKPGVLSWIGERGAEFVTNESQTTKDAIRGLLMRSVTEKHSVDELSRVIRPLVGLNKPQAYANMRYYENVLNTLSDQHPRTSKEVIQRRAQEAAWKYAEKQHRERAYMIARTEMSFAYNRGAYEGIKQAQEMGLMGAVVKIWSTSQGGNVCPDCEALEGEEVGMDGTFFESRGLFRGDNLVPPLHPRCECAIVYQEVGKKFLSDKDDGVNANPYDSEGDFQSIEDCKNFENLGKYFKKEYNIYIDERIYSFNYEAVSDTLKGVEYMLKEFPELKGNINTIGILTEQPLGSDGHNIYLNKRHFLGDTPYIDARLEEKKEKNEWCKDMSREGLGVHEATHCLERLLVDNNRSLDVGFPKRAAFDSGEEASKIVNKAIEQVRNTPYGEHKTAEQLISEITPYEPEKPSETMADAFVGSYANGENANPLSKEIVKQTHKRYEELLKGR